MRRGMKSIFFLSIVSSSKNLGAGLATIGVIGSGAGIGIVFAGLLLANWKPANRQPVAD